MKEILLAYCYIVEAKNVDLTHIGNEIRTYRRLFIEQQIRGTMIYDGAYFIHLLVGSPLSIVKAEHTMDALQKGVHKEILYYGKLAEAAHELNPLWQVGYILHDQTEAPGYLETLRDSKGNIEAIMTCFQQLQAISDTV